MGAHLLLFFKLLLLVVIWGLDFEFGLGLKLGFQLGLQFELSLRLGLRVMIAFFCLHAGVQISLVFFK